MNNFWTEQDEADLRDERYDEYWGGDDDAQRLMDVPLGDLRQGDYLLDGGQVEAIYIIAGGRGAGSYRTRYWNRKSSMTFVSEGGTVTVVRA